MQKQADVLTGAIVLPNPNGTAPGQWLSGMYDGHEKIIMLLPGPPFELKAMFDEQCVPRLRAKLPPAFIAARTLKIANMGESAVDARVAPIYKTYSDVQTTILAGAGEVLLHFRSRAKTLEEAEARVEDVAGRVEDELGDFVFSRNNESLEPNRRTLSPDAWCKRWRLRNPALEDCCLKGSLPLAAVPATSWVGLLCIRTI
jgi:nicotinamide-nucleotide amidase